MHRAPVRSTNIRSVGYDKKSEQLEIEFHQGKVYLYFDVPESVYRGLISAGSKGSYFAMNIKDSFASRQV